MISTDTLPTTEQALELLQAAMTALSQAPSAEGFPRERVAKFVEHALVRLLTAASPGDQGFVADVLGCSELLDDALRLAEAHAAPSTHQVQAMSAIERAQAILYYVAFRIEPDNAVAKAHSLRPRSFRPRSSPPSAMPPSAAASDSEPTLSLEACNPDDLEALLSASSAAPQALEGNASPQLHLRVEVTFGSPTNFYLGFEDDISQGGLFVATYNRRVVGTPAMLSVTLPGGHVVVTPGTVRWVRDVIDPDEDSLPGIGVGFTALKPGDRQAIEAFIRVRAPMFYDVDA